MSTTAAGVCAGEWAAVQWGAAGFECGVCAEPGDLRVDHAWRIRVLGRCVQMPLVVCVVVAALLIKFAWLIAATILIVGGAWWAGKCWKYRDDTRAAICARADRQHAAVLAGNELLGVYGDYPPAV